MNLQRQPQQGRPEGHDEDEHVGQNTCPDCAGTGRVEAARCATCAGDGVVVEVVGDA